MGKKGKPTPCEKEGERLPAGNEGRTEALLSGNVT